MKPRDFFRFTAFILLFLLVNKILTAWFVPWSRAPYEYETTRRGFESVQQDLSVVILGDSHPQKDFMAEKLHRGYNFASSAESYIFTYYKIRHYLEEGPFQPSLAVVPIDMHSFSSFRLTRALTQDPAFWNRYVDYLEVGRESGLFWPYFSNRILGEFALIGGLDAAAAVLWPTEPPTATVMTAGYLRTEEDFSGSSEDERWARAEERAAFHFSGYTYNEATLVTYFYRLLDLLESHGVEVVLVWYPVSEEYYLESSSYIPAESHLESVKSLLSDHSPALVLDYHDLFFGRPELFSDSDHLNARGAETLTNQFIQDLEGAGLLSFESQSRQQTPRNPLSYIPPIENRAFFASKVGLTPPKPEGAHPAACQRPAGHRCQHQ